MPRPDYILRITLNTADSVYSVQMSPDYDATGSLLHEGVVVNTGYCPSRVQPASEILGNQAVVGYSYDPLGRLSGKLLGSGKSIAYQYNMRGQLTGLSHPVFSQTLFYENGPDPCYNGNISGIRLRYGDGPAIDRVYSYDNLNRLTSLTSSDGYNTAYTYNLNSSPLTIQRYGMLSDRSIGLVDDLELSYSGNRPLCVSDYAPPVLLESSLEFDAGGDGEALYGYDADGRLISDTGRGITSISYTPGNLPVRTTVKGGTFDCSYSADGRKLKTVTDVINGFTALPGDKLKPGNTFEPDSLISSEIIGGKFPVAKGTPEERYYIGPFELVKPAQSGFIVRGLKPGLARINMNWGYFDSEGNNNEYVTDYQGNVRAVTRGDEVVQTTDYYPYGLPMPTSTGAAANRYKYTGKEFETRAGLNTFDFQARQYGPAAPFFSTTDPKAWTYHHLNPFLFCAANPILNIDPTGKWSIKVHVAEDRNKIKNGFAVVSDRHGKEIFRFDVRARGYKGRNRMKEDNDTPTGVYKIPNNPWIKREDDDRKSYGPNPRLALIPLSGEAVESGRSNFRVHGGRQEVQMKDGTWVPVEEPELHDTKGCIRAYDEDVKKLKEITDDLMSNDPMEAPETLTVTNDYEDIMRFEALIQQFTNDLFTDPEELDDKFPVL